MARKEDEKKVVKRELSDMQENLIRHIISDEGNLDFYRPFPIALKRFSHDNGDVCLYQVIDHEKEILAPLTIKKLSEVIVQYLVEETGAEGSDTEFRQYNKFIDACNATRVATTVACASHADIDLKSEPDIVRFSNQPGWCLMRLSFPLVPYENPIRPFRVTVSAPTWSEFLERTTNPESFCTFIGSLFDPHSDRKQALYLAGDADSGKSTLISVIVEMLGGDLPNGGATCQLEMAETGSRFWKAKLLGKRLCTMPEANPKFFASAAWKSLTGSSYATIEKKGIDSTMMRINTKVLIDSNHDPEFHWDESVFNRIIWCRTEAYKGKGGGVNHFKNQLREELPEFIIYCWHLYKDLEDGAPIPNDQTELRLASEEVDVKYHRFLQDCFDFEPDACCVAQTFLEIMEAYGITNRRHVRYIKNILLQHYKVKKRQRLVDGKNKNFYFGIKLRTRTRAGYSTLDMLSSIRSLHDSQKKSHLQLIVSADKE